jgi:hypothetical protein
MGGKTESRSEDEGNLQGTPLLLQNSQELIKLGGI